MNLTCDRRYEIQSHDEYRFYTGITYDHEQVLTGLICPKLVAFHFNFEGNWLSIRDRPVPFLERATPPYDVYDERIQPLIDEWRNELGLRVAPIRVKKFFSQVFGVGIEDYPSHFDDTLDDSACDEAKRVNNWESIETWHRNGQFVLRWGNDYWLDESGVVISS